jgi:hypothetical protein
LLPRVSHELRHQFGIGHATIQLETEELARQCELRPDHVVYIALGCCMARSPPGRTLRARLFAASNAMKLTDAMKQQWIR